jgi:Helix-turn-helix domain
MSGRLMGAVFDLDIPASWKLVLLAMADHAHDDGTSCYPSIETLARKTSQSRRGVQKIMRRLEEAGLIEPSKVSRGGRRRSTEYTLTLANSEPRSRFPSTQPRTTVPETANHSAPNSEPQRSQPRTGFARTYKNHQEPSVNLARLSPRSSTPPVENGEQKTVSQLAREKSVTPVGKTQKELDARRRFLLDQAVAVQQRFQTAV